MRWVRPYPTRTSGLDNLLPLGSVHVARCAAAHLGRGNTTNSFVDEEQVLKLVLATVSREADPYLGLTRCACRRPQRHCSTANRALIRCRSSD